MPSTPIAIKYTPRLPGFTYAVAGGPTIWARRTFETVGLDPPETFRNRDPVQLTISQMNRCGRALGNDKHKRLNSISRVEREHYAVADEIADFVSNDGASLLAAHGRVVIYVDLTMRRSFLVFSCEQTLPAWRGIFNLRARRAQLSEHEPLGSLRCIAAWSGGCCVRPALGRP